MAQGAPGTEKQPSPAESYTIPGAVSRQTYQGTGLMAIPAAILNRSAEKRRVLQDEEWQRQAQVMAAETRDEIAALPEVKQLALSREKMREMYDAEIDNPDAYDDEQVAAAMQRLTLDMGAAASAEQSIHARNIQAAPGNPYIQNAATAAIEQIHTNMARIPQIFGAQEAALAREQAGRIEQEQTRLEAEEGRETLRTKGAEEERLLRTEAEEGRRGVAQAARVQTREMRRRAEDEIALSFKDPRQRMAMVQGIAEAHSAMEENGYSQKMIEAALQPVAEKVGVELDDLIDEVKLVDTDVEKKKIARYQEQVKRAEAAGDEERAAKFQQRIDESVERSALAAEERMAYEEHLADQPIGVRAGIQLVDKAVSAAYTAAGIAVAPFQFAGTVLEETGEAVRRATDVEGALPEPRPTDPERADQGAGLRERARGRLERRLGE